MKGLQKNMKINGAMCAFKMILKRKMDNTYAENIAELLMALRLMSWVPFGGWRNSLSFESRGFKEA